MAELAKTTAGRLRISAATDRMDRTVGELGQQFRHDVPQGRMEVWNTVSLRHPPNSFQFHRKLRPWRNTETTVSPGRCPLLLMSQMEAKLMTSKGLFLKTMSQQGSGWILTPLTTSRRQTSRSSFR